MENLDAFETGLVHFDEGRYFEAHEVWEDLWHEASGERHAFLQSIIQVAVALHHASNGNLRGARKLLARAIGYLEKGGPAAGGIDANSLRDRILDFELAIQKTEQSDTLSLPYFRMPRKL